MGGRSEDRGAEDRARKAEEESKAATAKYEAEKMQTQRTAAEEAAGRYRSRSRRTSLLSAAKLGTTEQTLGSTGV